LPPASAGGKQMYIKKALAKNRKVWLKPLVKLKQKPPVKTGGN